ESRITNMKKRDIVITGLQDFHAEIGSNAVNLAYEFAKKHRVLYVNYPLDRLSKWRNASEKSVQRRIAVRNGRQKALEKINDNLWVYTPDVILESVSKIPFRWLFDEILKNNNRKYAKSIQTALSELHINDFILFEDGDLYRTLYLKEWLKPSLFIYYSRDNLIATPYFQKHGPRIEKALMQKADAVLCNSEYLASLARQHNPESYDAGQGVDTAPFEKAPGKIPDEINNAKKPVIGYIGVLSSLRLDVALLETVAERNPQWTFAFVGPEDETFRKSRLHEWPNVLFTGRKDFQDLPAYLHGFDVAINPQLINDVTIGNYPRKIDEYLAAQKPVVAVKTEAMKMFSEVVFLAEGAGEFEQRIKNALESKDFNKQERLKTAKRHTWENSVDKIYQVIQHIEKQKGHGTKGKN
ncbi:MAG: glycosyltransferase, partial [Bacteroidota bacterium]